MTDKIKQRAAQIALDRTIPVVTIKVGTAVRIEFADTDGAFEIHYDTGAHRNQLVVKETEGLPDSFERTGILYCEDFSMLPPEADDCDSTGTIRHNDDEDDEDDDDQSEYTFAIYSCSLKGWYNKEEQAWTSERIGDCEYSDLVLAHAKAYELLQAYSLTDQIKVIRNDQNM